MGDKYALPVASWARGLHECTHSDGRYKFISFDDLSYSDFHSQDADLVEFAFPFEDLGSYCWNGHYPQARFAVPNGVNWCAHDASRPPVDRKYQDMAWLYCASVLDYLHACYQAIVVGQEWPSIDPVRFYGQRVNHALMRLENSLNLLRPAPLQTPEPVYTAHRDSGHAKALAKAMKAAFNRIIRPTLLRTDGHVTALNIRTEFTADEWLTRLKLSCFYTCEDILHLIPELPDLQTSDGGGYVLRMNVDDSQRELLARLTHKYRWPQ